MLSEKPYSLEFIDKCIANFFKSDEQKLQRLQKRNSEISMLISFVIKTHYLQFDVLMAYINFYVDAA